MSESLGEGDEETGAEELEEVPEQPVGNGVVDFSAMQRGIEANAENIRSLGQQYEEDRKALNERLSRIGTKVNYILDRTPEWFCDRAPGVYLGAWLGFAGVLAAVGLGIASTVNSCEARKNTAPLAERQSQTAYGEQAPEESPLEKTIESIPLRSPLEKTIEPIQIRVTDVAPTFTYATTTRVNFNDDLAPGMDAFVLYKDGSETMLLRNYVAQSLASFDLPKGILENLSFQVYARDRGGNISDKKRLYVLDGVVLEEDAITPKEETKTPREEFVNLFF